MALCNPLWGEAGVLPLLVFLIDTASWTCPSLYCKVHVGVHLKSYVLSSCLFLFSFNQCRGGNVLYLGSGMPMV